MLNFLPEHIDAMWDRFPAAVANTVDPEAIRLGTVTPPDEQRRHTFDFANGLRLVISVAYERWLRLHVYASLRDGESEIKQIIERDAPKGSGQALTMLQGFVRQGFREICCHDRPKEWKYSHSGLWFADVPASWPVAKGVANAR